MNKDWNYLEKKKFHIFAIDIESFSYSGENLDLDVEMLKNGKKSIEKIRFSGVEYFSRVYQNDDEFGEIIDFLFDGMKEEDLLYNLNSVSNVNVENDHFKRVFIYHENYTLEFVAKSVVKRDE